MTILRRWCLFWLTWATMAAIIVAGLLWLGLATAGAQSGNHGDGHAEHHADYQHWQDRRGFGCCDDRDCRPTRAYIGDDGRWRALADGQWLVVPPDAVLPIPSPDGRSHICHTPGALEPRCFVPGEPRS